MIYTLPDIISFVCALFNKENWGNFMINMYNPSIRTATTTIETKIESIGYNFYDVLIYYVAVITFLNVFVLNHYK